MNRKETQAQIINALEDTKAQEITVLDVRKKSDMTDFMIIVTGNSTRHVKSMAGNLIKAMKDLGEQPFGSEGETNGEWVLVDFENIVVHIMQRDVREFYNLEKLWGTPSQDEV